MTEITRRCPEELRLYDSHPGGDLPVSLGVVDARGRLLVTLNDAGLLRLLATWDGAGLGESRADFFSRDWGPGSFPTLVHALCDRLRIPSYKRLPPTTPAALVYRYLGSLLEQSAFSSRTWECRSGYLPRDGRGPAESPEFSDFPLARKRLRAEPEPILGDRRAAAGFWFLRVDGDPVLCAHEDGMVWDRDLNAADLVPNYAERHRIWPLVAETAGALLG
jgi:hypothetical protein